MSFHTDKDPPFVIHMPKTDIRAFMPIPRIPAPAIKLQTPVFDIRSFMPGNDRIT
jgi:hypothetical protein